MNVKERHEWEEKLLAQIQKIGESVKGITPADGHLSMTWFPDGHMDVYLFSGNRTERSDGGTNAAMILDAWAEIQNGEMRVSRV